MIIPLEYGIKFKVVTNFRKWVIEREKDLVKDFFAFEFLDINNILEHFINCIYQLNKN